jgi:hypothetical protein
MRRLAGPCRKHLHGFEACRSDACQPRKPVDSSFAEPADEQPRIAAPVEGELKTVQEVQFVNAHPVARCHAAEPAPDGFDREGPWRYRPGRRFTRPPAPHVRDVSW